MTALAESRLPLPLLRRGKVREVYEVDADHLLLVASDRVSAFDVVMREPIPRKGAVLTQISAFWFERLADVFPSHYVTAAADEIVDRIPALRGRRSEIAGRAMLVRRTAAGAVRVRRARLPLRLGVGGVPRLGHARRRGAAGRPAGERPARAAALLARDQGGVGPRRQRHVRHRGRRRSAATLTARLRDASFAVYRAGRDHAAGRGIIIADTKFEFGTGRDGSLILIDEVLTPDSSRFWPADRYRPGQAQPSFDKQPLRDYLAGLRTAGAWNGEAPPPTLPAEVVDATSRRYLEAFRLITGRELERRMIRTAPEGRWFIAGAWAIALVLLVVAARSGSAGWWIGGRRVDRARGLGRRLLPRSGAGLVARRTDGGRAGRRQSGERDRGRRAACSTAGGRSGSRSS